MFLELVSTYFLQNSMMLNHLCTFIAGLIAFFIHRRVRNSKLDMKANIACLDEETKEIKSPS